MAKLPHLKPLNKDYAQLNYPQFLDGQQRSPITNTANEDRSAACRRKTEYKYSWSGQKYGTFKCIGLWCRGPHQYQNSSQLD